jgi:hypothetical protein
MFALLASLMVNPTRKRPESATAYTGERQPVQKLFIIVNNHGS